jgi:hypothetical protein
MNKIVVFIIFLILPFSLFAENKKFQIGTNPTSLAFGGLDIQANYAIHENVSIGFSFVSMSIEESDAEVTGSSKQINARYFFDGFALDSWYLKPYYESGSVEGSNSYGGYADIDYTLIGLIGGYQWAWKTTYLQLGIGPASLDMNFKSNIIEEEGFTFTRNIQGELNFGFMF